VPKKKPAKKQNLLTKIRQKQKLIIIALTAVLLLIATGYFVIARYIQPYKDTMDQAATVSIRELILQAADAIKTDAPVDPKTGDIYFPQAKLYLPNDSSFTRLTYAYDSAGASGEELEISNRAVFDQNATPLYSARNIEEVFKAVPKLQSCQRGIKLVYKELGSGEGELKQAIKLDNGRTLYVYLEKDCPELNETVDLLKNINSY
jgi:hypothetical protein